MQLCMRIWFRKNAIVQDHGAEDNAIVQDDEVQENAIPWDDGVEENAQHCAAESTDDRLPNTIVNMHTANMVGEGKLS